LLQRGIIHTSTATIAPLKALAGELLPGVEVAHILGDSILPQRARCGGDVDQVAGRLIHCARFTEQSGAGTSFTACSLVGEVVDRMQAAVKVRGIRIDEALAEAAIASASKIGVAATLPTTLNPTTRRLEAKAREASKAISPQPRLPQAECARGLSSPRLGMESVRQAIAANARGNEPGASGRPRRNGPP
jgi:hypothetical protein